MYFYALFVLIRPVLYVSKPVLSPFDVRKAENYLEKTENDRSFTVRKQKVCF